MKIAVLGDAMLDIMRIGSSTRVSPECNTCLVVNEDKIERRLGGAANVAYWLSQGTRHEITLYCHYGEPKEDEADASRYSTAFQAICRGYGIRLDPSLARAFPYTITTKERIGVRTPNGGVNYITRIDNDMTERITPREIQRIIQSLRTTQPDIIVIADYRKTMFVGAEGQDLIAAFCGRTDDIFYSTDDDWYPPIIVNSKRPRAWANSRVDFLIYNQSEGLDSWPGVPPENMIRDTVAGVHIMTLGAEGLQVDFHPDTRREGLRIPSMANQAVDVTGAGDAFLAGLVAELAVIKNPKTDLERADVKAIIHGGQKWAADCVGQIGCGEPNRALYK